MAMDENIRSFTVWFIQVMGICAVVLFSVCPVSCKATDEGLQLLQGDYTAPVIQSYTVKDAFSVNVVFSRKIRITQAVITSESQTDVLAESDDPSPSAETALETGGEECVDIVYDETCREATIFSPEKMLTGLQYTLYGDVRDDAGNTLTFCIQFTGYNSRVPRLLISEIHPGYVSGTNRCEFIELYALTAGNLSGLTVYSANDGENRGFALPAVDVKAGEVIILHMRKKGDSCINETEADLSLAAGTEKTDYVSANARDLWADNEKACLGDKEDVIVLINSCTGAFIDAVPYAPAGTASWAKDTVRKAAAEVAAAGIWNSAEPCGAVQSDLLTTTKTLIRRGCIALYDAVQKQKLGTGPVLQTSDDWYTADSKNVTPGTVE